jgi:lipopolysaccharide export system permease protein
MLAFSRLSGDSELVVLRASGISLYQLLTPIVPLALLLGGLALIVSTQLKPWGHRTLSATLFEIAKSRSTAGLEEGVFNKLGELTLYGQSVDYRTGDLNSVVVDDRRDEDNRKILFAKSASIVSDEEQRTITIKMLDGSMHEQVDGKYILTRFATNDVVMNPDQLYGSQAITEITPRAMTLPELKAESQNFRQLLTDLEAAERVSPNTDGTPLEITLAGGKQINAKGIKRHIRRLQMEAASRWSMPYAALILAFVAVPLGVQPSRTQRAWGPTIAFAMGLAVFVIYYALLSLSMTLQDNGHVSAMVAAWIPNLFATAAAVGMLYAVASERIQSVPQLFDGWMKAARRIFSLIRPRKELR